LPSTRTRLRVELRVEGKGLALLEDHLAGAKSLDADFGSPEIEQHANALVSPFGRFPNQRE
jgi:hypothetical protein